MIKILQDSTSRFQIIQGSKNYFALSPNSKLRNVIPRMTLRISLYASIWPVALYRGLELLKWREICEPTL